jgi:hypothetical protein
LHVAVVNVSVRVALALSTSPPAPLLVVLAATLLFAVLRLLVYRLKSWETQSSDMLHLLQVLAECHSLPSLVESTVAAAAWNLFISLVCMGFLVCFHSGRVFFCSILSDLISFVLLPLVSATASALRDTALHQGTVGGYGDLEMLHQS